MSPEEKKKLYDAIGYEGEDTSNAAYPKEVSLYGLYRLNKILLQYIDIDMGIELKTLDLNVWSKINENDTQ